ncbi:hypothetical protein ANO11243_018000 [Dothideomycetidae sp. 11243]|nr:hypothetical protein ANO11243_018000 [fungal sp. No.11243]
MLSILKLSVLGVLTSQARATAFSARQIFQFPNTSFVSIENVAVRPNGELILTTSSAPTIYLLNPATNKPSATLLHTFPGVNSCLGITETVPDVYAVACGNTSKETFTGTQGSFAIWSIDLRCDPPKIKEIAAITEAKFLNGVTRVNDNANAVLVADSELGVVFHLNMETGKYRTAISSQYFAPTTMVPIGLNGIRTFGQDLYFTNSAKGIFGRIPITRTGDPAGAVSVIAQSGSGDFFDDFAIGRKGNAWLVNHPDSLIEVTTGGQQTTIVNSTDIVQPSSVIFSQDGRVLYMVTAGFASASGYQNGQKGEESLTGGLSRDSMAS